MKQTQQVFSSISSSLAVNSMALVRFRVFNLVVVVGVHLLSEFCLTLIGVFPLLAWFCLSLFCFCLSLFCFCFIVCTSTSLESDPITLSVDSRSQTQITSYATDVVPCILYLFTFCSWLWDIILPGTKGVTGFLPQVCWQGIWVHSVHLFYISLINKQIISFFKMPFK